MLLDARLSWIRMWNFKNFSELNTVLQIPQLMTEDASFWPDLALTLLNFRRTGALDSAFTC